MKENNKKEKKINAKDEKIKEKDIDIRIRLFLKNMRDFRELLEKETQKWNPALTSIKDEISKTLERKEKWVNGELSDKEALIQMFNARLTSHELLKVIIHRNNFNKTIPKVLDIDLQYALNRINFLKETEKKECLELIFDDYNKAYTAFSSYEQLVDEMSLGSNYMGELNTILIEQIKDKQHTKETNNIKFLTYALVVLTAVLLMIPFLT